MFGYNPGQALGFQRIFGFSRDITGGVLNLSTGDRDAVVYIASHTAVIYDIKTGEQTVLQGHSNPIQCICATEDKQIIATADCGIDAMICFWDANTGDPLRSFSQPHNGLGVSAMAMQPDGSQIATLSGLSETDKQFIGLWNVIDMNMEEPQITCAIPQGDPQHAISFNFNTGELISTGNQRVYFWESSEGSSTFKYYSPPLRAKDFKQTISDFKQSVSIPGDTGVVTATEDGDIVVWEQQGRHAEPGTRPTDRRATKILRIHNTPITYIGVYKDYLVSGGEDGCVRFFDGKLRLVAWFEEIEAGAITSVAFRNDDYSSQHGNKSNNNGEASLLGQFSCPNFIVGTKDTKIISVLSNLFEDPTLEPRCGTLLLEGVQRDVVSISCHPNRAEVVAVTASGNISCWHLAEEDALLAQVTLPKTNLSTVTYTRDGKYILVGLSSGHLKFFYADSLEEGPTFKTSPSPVTHIATSISGKFIATADSAARVTLLLSSETQSHNPNDDKFEMLSQLVAHSGSIVDLKFMESSGKDRLFSLGSDASIVEFDLLASDADQLEIKTIVDLTQDGTATYNNVSALCALPTRLLRRDSISSQASTSRPVSAISGNSRLSSAGYKRSNAHTSASLLVADDAFKIKCLDANSGQVQSTTLGPTYGYPITSLLSFEEGEKSYLAYGTDERIVGLIALPLDGHPSSSMGFIAHPGKVLDISMVFDSRRLVTCGGGCVMVWNVNASCVADNKIETPTENKWADTLEGGSQGDVYQEVKDFFYYAQLKVQGENTIHPRAIKGSIPFSMVPLIIQSLGFYPSKADIHSLMVDLRAQLANSEHPDEVTLEQFLKVYINHKPVFDLQKDDIAKALVELGADARTGAISREDLIHALSNYGEKMTDGEISSVFGDLCGSESIDEALPAVLDCNLLTEEVLGFGGE